VRVIKGRNYHKKKETIDHILIPIVITNELHTPVAQVAYSCITRKNFDFTQH